MDEEPDDDDENPSYQDTGWYDGGPVASPASRRSISGDRSAITPDLDPFLMQAREYTRAETEERTDTEERGELQFTSMSPNVASWNSNNRHSMTASGATGYTCTSALQPHPDHDSFLYADGGSLVSSPPQSLPVPTNNTSRVYQTAGSPTSHMPVQEASPKGSPRAKYEECVTPSSNFEPNQPRFGNRVYTADDIDPDTFHGRVASFVVHRWNVPFLDRRLLARLGFYYEGNGDEVVCSGCDGTLSGWEPEDDPAAEHFRISPTPCFTLDE